MAERKTPWPVNTDALLLYIGDAHDRRNVTPIWLKWDLSTRRQAFLWPDGAEHWVPIHTVVFDTPAVRDEKGLPPL